MEIRGADCNKYFHPRNPPRDSRLDERIKISKNSIFSKKSLYPFIFISNVIFRITFQVSIKWINFQSLHLSLLSNRFITDFENFAMFKIKTNLDWIVPLKGHIFKF